MSVIDTNGITTYYEDEGAGQPIIFLHGGMSDHQLWAELMQPVTDDFRVIVPDLRGHGQSDTSDHESYDMELYADDLDALIRHMALDQPLICGLSLGGMVGYVYSIRHPANLAGLITLGAPLPMTFSRKEMFIRTTLLRILTPVMGNDTIMSWVSWANQKAFGENSAGDLDEAERIRSEHSCKDPELSPQERKKIMQGVLNYIGSPMEYQSIMVPVLKMYGEHEPFLEDHASYFIEHVSQCEIREIPGAGHNSHIDNPDFVIESIREFAARITDQATSEEMSEKISASG